jgi:hypothetical protein
MSESVSQIYVVEGFSPRNETGKRNRPERASESGVASNAERC